jgi:hypothetical protein
MGCFKTSANRHILQFIAKSNEIGKKERKRERKGKKSYLG